MELNEGNPSSKLLNSISVAFNNPISKYEIKNSYTSIVLWNGILKNSNYLIKQHNKIELRCHNKPHRKNTASPALISKRGESKKQYEDCNEKKVVPSNCSSKTIR